MKPASRISSNSVEPKVVEIEQSTDQEPPIKPLTRGQILADKLAAQVGSWGFLIGQSAILAGWVGINSMPGMPHWDESPFMMLNLVFSFASAYTAPVVLMSQNRQSDTDRRNAEIDHQVNRRAGKNIELLHEKLDQLQAQQINELTQIVKEQQRVLNELTVTLVPTSRENKELKVNLLPGLHIQSNSKFPKEAVTNKPFTIEQSIGDNDKVVEKLNHG